MRGEADWLNTDTKTHRKRLRRLLHDNHRNVRFVDEVMAVTLLPVSIIERHKRCQQLPPGRIATRAARRCM